MFKSFVAFGRCICIVFVLVVLFFHPAKAQQLTSFSNEPDAFQREMEELFKITGDKQAAKIFLDKLKFYLELAEVPSTVIQQNIDDCNMLLQRKAKALTDFTVYFETYYIFAQKQFWTNNYSVWHSVLKSMLTDRKVPLRHINQFLDHGKKVVGENIIFSTNSVKWSARTPDFTFVNQDGILRVDVGTTDLLCHYQRDSITIYATKGSFLYDTKKWSGKGGRVNWEKSEFDPEKVSATLSNYALDMTKSSYVIDSVSFINTNYFGYPLYGMLENKVSMVSNPENAMYPKFKSSNQTFRIDNIFPKINYVGGFSQVGSKFQGTGTPEQLAEVNIFRNDTLFVQAKSLSFGLFEKLIVSNVAEVSIRLDTAKITHPGLIFRYMAEYEELNLIRGKEGLEQSPYFDTYHNVSLDVELIRWKLKEPWMEFRMVPGAANNYALFESLSYYREEFFNQIQGMDAIHPLQGLRNCGQFYRGNPFTALQYADYLRLPESPVRQQIINLSFYGFIDYDVNSDLITLKPRLFDYLLFRVGKKDFDVIRFNSVTPGETANAILDLNNYDLKLKGVSAVAIADHQNVAFFPKNGDLLLKHNRNFRFDGVINAGMMNMYGNGFYFDYDKFRIDLDKIDSLKMRVRTGALDYFGQGATQGVRNTIAELSGHLQIDKPDNKSGNNFYPEYPIVTSTKQSFVYYDNKLIQDGVYHRDNFYFVVDPFEMDSISNLTRGNTVFAGTLHSAIFPDIKENLVVRPDYSLGFVRKSPPEGYPVYGGPGRFTNNIDLSNNGLKGGGELQYITSKARSEEFTFLPNETKGMATDFSIEKRTKGVAFPDAKTHFAQINFFPERQELIARSMEENFDMFGKDAEMDGILKVSPTGLTGQGNLFMMRATLNSRHMNFDDHTVMADTSNFKLATKGSDDISFNTQNLVSTIDFEKRIGTFRSIAGGSRVDFTDNRYMSFINEFSWNMDNNEILLGAKGSKGNKFVSVHKKQDSLFFYAPMARYDAENKLIEAQEVTDILTADAHVLLKDGRITIREDAVMDPLDSVTIVLKDTVATHTIYGAQITIDGAKRYTGFGSYDYMNAKGKVYKLFMEKISANEKSRTVANGSIGDAAAFDFDDYFSYKGNFTMTAGRKLFDFDGAAKMIHQDTLGPKTYVRFKSIIDPLKVRIPIGEKVENFQREGIHKDFFIRKDSTHVYSSFLESRKDYSDIKILSGQGFLVHNEVENSFDLASEIKLANNDTTGVLMRFMPNASQIMGQGKLNLGVEMDHVQTRAAGKIIDSRPDNQTTITALLGVDFFFDAGLAAMIYKTIVESKDAPSDVTPSEMTRNLRELVTQPEVDLMFKEAVKELENNKMPDVGELFTFSRVEMKWNHSKKCYYIDGEADLAMIRGRNVNKKVKVKAELARSGKSGSIDLLIETGDQWFYFSYKASLMQVLSSIKEFNVAMTAIKPEDRKTKGGLGGKVYTYQQSSDSKRKRFLEKFGDTSQTATDSGNQQEDETDEEQE